MSGQLLFSASILTVGLLLAGNHFTATLSDTTPNVTLFPPRRAARLTLSDTTPNVTLFPPRRTTDLIVSDVNDVTIFLIMAQQAELPVFYEVVKPALSLAIDRARILYPNLRFHLVARKDENPCVHNVAGALAAEEFYLRKVDVIVGPACSLALDPVARMASYWNIPIFTGGGIGVEFAKKQTYTSLTRMAFSLDRVSHFLVKVIRENDWHHVSLIVDETEMSNTLIKVSLQAVFKEIEFGHEINLDIQTFTRRDNSTVNYQKILKQSARAARVFILISTGELVRHLLLEAYELGMNNGEYAFFGVELVKSTGTSGDFSWYQSGDKRNKQAREMYESLMMVMVRVPTSPEYATFTHKVTQMAVDEFGGKTIIEQVNPIVAAFYDCILMYAWAYNKTLAVGGDPRDGRTLARRLWDNTFKDGLTGDISINENGDREADYTLNDLDPETGIMRPVATYYGARRLYEKIQGFEVVWPGGKKTAPPDVPYCGFTGDAPHCVVKDPFPIWATILIIFFCITIIGFIVTFFVSKKMKYEADLADLWWKVCYDG
ncbi:unnamed protein product [Medioppia subpectinata]|uniref:Receptor ligand binding region domain-containing protein n=1 Tax=Medioppia subpectinata TaxID=1979941 RepID=A0A7R9KNT3_9ACAR|nr:unnamed protein product [Medioppia subpectinata]CAG2105995.1 unnamed protein product [Medioppia subpectinata]